MCLITKQSSWLIAEKDIKCFKIVEEECWSYVTPYRGTMIPEQVINGEFPFHAMENGKMPFTTKLMREKEYYTIEGGAIHAFRRRLKATRKALGAVRKCVFKCVIPKGTQYAIGIDGDICAKELMFVEKVFG